jgi:hypothetical protein
MDRNMLYADGAFKLAYPLARSQADSYTENQTPCFVRAMLSERTAKYALNQHPPDQGGSCRSGFF